MDNEEKEQEEKTILGMPRKSFKIWIITSILVISLVFIIAFIK